MPSPSVATDVLRLQRTRVFVAGDALLDVYVEGTAGRMSPEAPVPVVLESGRRAVLGGAANVAANLAAFGAEVELGARVGRDPEGEELRARGEPAGSASGALVAADGAPTTRKTRVLAGYQQIVRIDREAVVPADAALQDGLVVAFEAFAGRGGACALVLADYGKGLLDPGLLRRLIDAARRRGVPVVTDPKSPDLGRYAGSTVLKPNLAEGKAALARLDPDAAPGAEALCDAALRLSGAEAVVLSCSADGVAAAGAGIEGTLRLRAHTLQVADVSGAGDTMVAMLALGAAAGLPLPRAVELANVAAGVVCEKLGTATLAPGEFLAAFKAVSESRRPEKLLGDREEAATVVAQLREEGRTVIFTNGCFDLLHAGHVSLLQRARALGDALVVALNTDDSIRRLKGEGRPMQALEDRVAVMASLACVDYVIAFAEDTPLELIRALRPDVIAKGGDYTPDAVVGGAEARAWNGRVEILPLVEGRSTTRLVQLAAG